jgi:hypothetical protein
MLNKVPTICILLAMNMQTAYQIQVYVIASFQYMLYQFGFSFGGFS